MQNYCNLFQALLFLLAMKLKMHIPHLKIKFCFKRKPLCLKHRKEMELSSETN